MLPIPNNELTIPKPSPLLHFYTAKSSNPPILHSLNHPLPHFYTIYTFYTVKVITNYQLQTNQLK